MLNTLASHNDDIRHLLEKGYALSIDSNYLVVRDIPYLDEKGNLQWGAFVSILIFENQVKVHPEDHQIFFCGSHPHEVNGNPIANLGGGVKSLVLKSDDLVVQRSFSNKPPDGFKDWFEKIESYVSIISGPAIQKYKVNPYTYRSVEEASDSVFKIRDTLTSRAEIGDLASKLKKDVIAIIGLGGTGSYLLDFLVKTPVREIRAFDYDHFYVHNAFRSPGKLEETEFNKKKAEIYQNRYENFRQGVKISACAINSESAEDLKGVTFAFLCVDKGTARKEIIDLLIKIGIPFIDVGIGLDRNKGPISGTIRTTYFSKESGEELLAKRLVPLTDLPDDIYKTNIQISELNALNACFAIVKYKQIRGFYADDRAFYHILFTLDNLQCLGD